MIPENWNDWWLQAVVWFQSLHGLQLSPGSNDLRWRHSLLQMPLMLPGQAVKQPEWYRKHDSMPQNATATTLVGVGSEGFRFFCCSCFSHQEREPNFRQTQRAHGVSRLQAPSITPQVTDGLCGVCGLSAVIAASIHMNHDPSMSRGSWKHMETLLPGACSPWIEMASDKNDKAKACTLYAADLFHSVVSYHQISPYFSLTRCCTCPIGRALITDTVTYCDQVNVEICRTSLTSTGRRLTSIGSGKKKNPMSRRSPGGLSIVGPDRAQQAFSMSVFWRLQRPHRREAFVIVLIHGFRIKSSFWKIWKASKLDA